MSDEWLPRIIVGGSMALATIAAVGSIFTPSKAEFLTNVTMTIVGGLLTYLQQGKPKSGTP